MEEGFTQLPQLLKSMKKSAPRTPRTDTGHLNHDSLMLPVSRVFLVWGCLPWVSAHLNVDSSPSTDSHLNSETGVSHNKRAQMALCQRRERNDQRGWCSVM